MEFAGITKERKDCVAQEKRPLRKPILTVVERQGRIESFPVMLLTMLRIPLYILQEGLINAYSPHLLFTTTYYILIKSLCRGMVQLVERRSPKPDVGGSSPLAPARTCSSGG